MIVFVMGGYIILVLALYLAYCLLLKTQQDACTRYTFLRFGVLLLLAFPILPVLNIGPFNIPLQSGENRSSEVVTVQATSRHSERALWSPGSEQRGLDGIGDNPFADPAIDLRNHPQPKPGDAAGTSGPGALLSKVLLQVWQLVSTSGLKSIAGLLAFILFGGVLIKGRRVLADLYRIKRFADNCRLTSHYKGIPVLSHSQAIPPFLAGIWQAKIFVPLPLMQNLTLNERELILEHEYVHAKRWDFHFHTLLAILETGLFWLPFFAPLKRAFTREMELSCDLEVLATTQQRREYAQLLYVCQKFIQASPAPLAVANRVDEPLITARLLNLKKPQHSASIVPALALAGLLLALAILLPVPSWSGNLQPAYLNPENLSPFMGDDTWQAWPETVFDEFFARHGMELSR